MSRHSYATAVSTTIFGIGLVIVCRFLARGQAARLVDFLHGLYRDVEKLDTASPGAIMRT